MGANRYLGVAGGGLLRPAFDVRRPQQPERNGRHLSAASAAVSQRVSRGVSVCQRAVLARGGAWPPSRRAWRIAAQPGALPLRVPVPRGAASSGSRGSRGTDATVRGRALKWREKFLRVPRGPAPCLAGEQRGAEPWRSAAAKAPAAPRAALAQPPSFALRLHWSCRAGVRLAPGQALRHALGGGCLRPQDSPKQELELEPAAP